MNYSNNEPGREDIITLMRNLKFTGMLESYDEVIADTIRRKAAMSYSLHQLLKSELKTRKLKSMQGRLSSAKFPEKRDIDNFIFTDTPINRNRTAKVV